MGGKKTGLSCMTAVAIAIVVGLLAGPAMAGIARLTDDDMDVVTASGQSTVISSGDGSPIEYTDNSMFSLAFTEPDAQSGLTALAIQNVVGELQLLVNLNVLSANGNVAGTDQRNFSLQSWGGTMPIADTVKTWAGVAAAPTACTRANSCNGNGGDGPSGDSIGGSPTIIGTGTIIQTTTTNNDGNGGNGPTVSVGNAATSPGGGTQAASASGDLVIASGSGSPVTATDDSSFNLLFGVSNAQSDLSALFISNVVGRSQMALNLNIASSAFTTTPFQTQTINGDVTGVVKQVNTGIQFRGTPLTGSTGTTTTVTIGVNHANQ